MNHILQMMADDLDDEDYDEGDNEDYDESDNEDCDEGDDEDYDLCNTVGLNNKPL